MRRREIALLGVWLATTSGCEKKSSVAASPDEAGAAPAAASAAPVEKALALLSQFEGEIDLSMTDRKTARTDAITVLVKAGKVHFDVPEKLGASSGLGPGAYFILDAAAKKLDIVSDAQKAVFVVDFNTSGDTLKAMGGGHRGEPKTSKTPTTTVTKTGKVDTVAGRKCEDWDVVADVRKGTVCVAEEDASWFQIPVSGLPTEQAWAAELLDGKHFPLRFIGYGKDGTTESVRLEVTKLDKRSLPDSAVAYPSTYTVNDFGQILAGMAGMHGGMHGMPGGAGGMPPGMPPGMAMPPGMTMPPPHSHP